MGLRTVLVVGLAAFAGWLLFRGVVQRHVPWIGLAVLAVPMVFFGWSERQWIDAEHTYSAVARSIAPGSAGVHCQRLGETFTYAGAELGHVDFDEDGVPTGAAMISYETCGHLRDYLTATPAQKAAPTLDEVVAVHVLTHESEHLAGILSEGLAECRAMQSDASVAMDLGASPAAARLLAQRYATEIYPRMPEDYRAQECRQDGPLDETPHDGVWP